MEILNFPSPLLKNKSNQDMQNSTYKVKNIGLHENLMFLAGGHDILRPTSACVQNISIAVTCKPVKCQPYSYETKCTNKEVLAIKSDCTYSLPRQTSKNNLHSEKNWACPPDWKSPNSLWSVFSSQCLESRSFNPHLLNSFST
jgi:hypothetical protein